MKFRLLSSVFLLTLSIALPPVAAARVYAYTAPTYASFYRNWSESEGLTQPGSSLFEFGMGKGKVSGDTSVVISQYNDQEVHYFMGKIAGRPIAHEFAARSSLPVLDGVLLVPSSYHARFHMHSFPGLVISGTFDSTLDPVAPIKIGTETFPRCRIHMRFHGTISKPSILGITRKTFTMTRTYIQQIGEPDGP